MKPFKKILLAPECSWDSDAPHPGSFNLKHLMIDNRHIRSSYSICVCVLASQSCPTLCDPEDCSPPGSSVCGILQARILQWVAIPFSRGSSWLRGQTWVSCIAGRFFTIWATRETYLIGLLAKVFPNKHK